MYIVQILIEGSIKFELCKATEINGLLAVIGALMCKNNNGPVELTIIRTVDPGKPPGDPQF